MHTIYKRTISGPPKAKRTSRGMSVRQTLWWHCTQRRAALQQVSYVCRWQAVQLVSVLLRAHIIPSPNKFPYMCSIVSLRVQALQQRMYKNFYIPSLNASQFGRISARLLWAKY